MQVHDHHYCLFYYVGSLNCLYDSLVGVIKVHNTSGQSFIPLSMSVRVPSPRSEGDILSSLMSSRNSWVVFNKNIKDSNLLISIGLVAAC
jgi:hypothetical protein